MIYLSLALAVVLVFSFFFFGITGLRVVLGIALVSIPFYLINDCFQLSYGEKFVFSIIMGTTIFPSIVYILGLFISFRISILVTFLALLLMAMVLRKFKPKD